jgi:hypothetical protein
MALLVRTAPESTRNPYLPTGFVDGSSRTEVNCESLWIIQNCCHQDHKAWKMASAIQEISTCNRIAVREGGAG